MTAIAGGAGWICPPEKLARIGELARTQEQKRRIEGWIQQWKAGPAVVVPMWFPEDRRTFTLLQYEGMSEDQLREKMAQFPRATEMAWQFWQAGQSNPEVSRTRQEEVYERMRRAAAERGVVLRKQSDQ